MVREREFPRSSKKNRSRGGPVEPTFPQPTEGLPRRSIGAVAVICVVLCGTFALSGAFLGGADRQLALPLHLELLGVGEEDRGGEWLDRLEFSIPRSLLEKSRGVAVWIGDRKFSFTKQEFLEQWQIGMKQSPGGREPLLMVVAPPTVSAPRSSLPFLSQWINWPGDGTVLWASLPVRLVVLVVVVTGGMCLLRLPGFGWAESMLLTATAWLAPSLSADDSRQQGTWRWWLSGLAVLATAVTILEVNQPFYFVQDDQFVSTLPAMLQCLRVLFSGRFPEWSPYQALGFPTTSLGGAMVLYPPMWLSYAVARFGLGNEVLTGEVFAIVHLVGGYAAMYWAGRRLGMRPSLAVLAGLCLVLSGYSLIVGRGWPHTLAHLIWAPLLVVALVDWEERPIGWKWVAWTGIVIALFYSSGFSQYWFYAMLCFVAAAGFMLATGRVAINKTPWMLAALLVGLSLLFPLLFQQMRFASDIVRPPAYGAGMEVGLWGTLLPWPFSQAPFPDNWGNAFREYRTQLYYSGTLFCLAVFLGWGVLVAYRGTKETFGRNVWLLATGFAMLLALGKPGFLWSIMTHTPVLDKTSNNPFRAMPCFTTYAVIAGGIMLERILRAKTPRVRVEWGLGAAVGALLLYHAFLARPSFYLFSDRPYPEMPREMAQLLKSGDPTGQHRCLPIAPLVSSAPGYALSLGRCLASYYSVLSFDIYDPLVESKPLVKEAVRRMHVDPKNAAYAYGIPWVVIDRVLEKPLPHVLNHEQMVVFGHVRGELVQASERVLLLPEVEIRRLPSACPLAFPEGRPEVSLPIELGSAGVTVDVSGLKEGGPVVVNFLAWPDMIALADGCRVSMEGDSWGRVRAVTPAGAHRLEVRYAPPWKKGILAGAVILLTTVLAGVGIQFDVRRRVKASTTSTEVASTSYNS